MEGGGQDERERDAGEELGPLATGGVQTCADIARGGHERVNLCFRRGAGDTSPKSRRPAGPGRSNKVNSNWILLYYNQGRAYS
jgi:hypothetical protein